MKLHRMIAPLGLLALVACSGDPAEEAEADGSDAIGEEAGDRASSSPDTDASEVADDGSGDAGNSAPQMTSAREFARLAKSKLAGSSEWQLPAAYEINGPVGNTILDEPPHAYIAFGGSPTDVDVFAEMETEFSSEQQFGRDGFYRADGTVSVRCSGPVTQPSPDAAPLVAGCSAVFGN